MIFDNSVKESPFLGFAGFGGGISWDAVQKYLDTVYVDDVFSTYLYEGTDSAQTITNGIDLSGEEGLVWLKARESLSSPYTNLELNCLFDNVRSGATGGSAGGGGRLRSDSTQAEQSSTYLDSYNSDGFTLTSTSSVAAAAIVNETGKDYVSWTFRKAPGFFDVVTYTGDKVVGRTVAHNLGSVPGMILIKGISGDSSALDWFVYHRSVGATGVLRLNKLDTTTTSSVFWNNTEPTSTHFTLSTSNGVNDTNTTYVAYLFAHDEQSFGTDSDEAIVKCGSFAATTSGHTESLGFEPQWLLAKRISTTEHWTLIDNMRGFPASDDAARLKPSTADIESTAPFSITNDGFKYTATGSTPDYVYMAIRRPHKPVTAGTDVFKSFTWAGDGVSENLPVPFAPDFMHVQGLNAGSSPHFIDKVRGKSTPLVTSALDFEYTAANGILEFYEDSNVKIGSDSTFNGNGFTYGGFALKRAPGFFDIVCYDGSGSTKTVAHKLGATPQLIIFKNRSSNARWRVYNSVNGATGAMSLNEDFAFSTGVTSAYFNDTAPTSTQFTVATNIGVNALGSEYVAYLFATLAGISKVGSYSGTGNNVDVDCGFSLGARFILIKRTDSTGDWYWWDSVRGINAGNDPYARFNLNTTEVTNTDYIDPLNSGFTVTSSAPDALNAVGGTYIFLAIA